MKKTFILNEIDCAVCAGKLENKIKNLDGVKSANLNFLLGKLVVEISENDEEKIIKNILKTIKNFDRRIEIESL